ncbi:MAG: class I SAM-dependent methyltransferase [Bacteroidota bacterium]|nr:class I SAM-dependent methyltransferase [Bacteroidota bacterium]
MEYYRIGRALKYFIFSRHRRGHGIHSPFVFDFINTVLRQDIPAEVIKTISELRKDMAESKEVLSVNDMGAGSQYLSSSSRSLSDLSRISSISKKYGRVLYNIAHSYNGNNILELGTSVGISTLYLGLGAPESKIISIEGCKTLSDRAKKNLKRCNIDNTDILTGDFDQQLAVVRDMGFSPSLVFVDGNHRKEPVLRYFAFLKELVTPDSVIIFDDINYSFEMIEAWNEIKSNSQVSVSIDIFQMGFVFFRGGMVKLDFVIRY